MSQTSRIRSEIAQDGAERPDYRPIADYGLLADCNSAALVDRDGSIDWLCLPRYDSAARVRAAARPRRRATGRSARRGAFTSERRYLPGTLVIETTFTTETGSVRLIDAMAFAEGQRGHDARPRRAARAAALGRGRRRARSSSCMELAPRPEYGLVRPLFRLPRTAARSFGGPNRLAVRAGVPVELRRRDDARGASRVARGRAGRLRAALGAGRERSSAEPTAARDVAARIADTAEAWRSWEAEHDIYDGPHRELVRH